MGLFSTLLAGWRGESPLLEARRDFAQMLDITHEMLLEANHGFWEGPLSDERRSALYQQDVRVNKMERAIRERITIFLAGEEAPPGLATALSLMSLVKDAERIGDYAKNFVELAELGDAPMADGSERDELRRIAEEAERLSDETRRVMAAELVQEARALYEASKPLCAACDALVAAVAASDHRAQDVVRLAVGARYYKRVVGHLMNLLSSLVMPLHKIDFFDEELLARQAS